MAEYVMALDAGTTSNRAVIFDKNSRMAASAQKEFTQYYPQPGWVEQDAMEIWHDMRQLMQEALRRSGLTAADIAAVGIANQRETAVVWDRRTGVPVYRAVVWQSRQTADISESLKKRGLTAEIRNKTGLPVDAYFSGTKIAWILDRIPGAAAAAERGELLFGTIDTWLLWNLTGGAVHATDYSNASRTMLYNIRELKWDAELLSWLNIPAALLPAVRPSSGIFGYTVPEILGAAVPVAGIAGDQQAALFGQNCFRPGDAKNTFGTGCFLLMHTGTEICTSRHGLVTTIAWGIDGRVEYALEGSVFVAGSAVQWLRDGLQIIENSAASEKIAGEVPDSGGVYCVPAFTGLGAPYWDENARGLIIGLTRGTSRAHLVRAVLESLAYQTRDVLLAMEADTGVKLTGLHVDGGAAANNLLLQFQADILHTAVIRAAMLETTALGAAHLAGLAVGVWKNREELAAAAGAGGRCFHPAMPEAQAEILCRNWQKAVTRARNWLAEE